MTEVAPPPQPLPYRPASRPRRVGHQWVSLVAALLAVGAIGGGIGYALGHDSTRTTPAVLRPAVTAPAVDTTTSTVAPYIPLASDFTITVNVLTKDCFGSAGCNITYRVQPSYHGSALDPTQRYTVTYQVNGTQDPQIGSFTMQGDEASVQQEEIAQTTTSSTQLAAQVTNVLTD
jgi:hypothetical protein